MSGAPIQEAKRTMNLFLQSLPMHCSVNIIRFGSNYQSLFDRSSILNNQTLQSAKNYISQTDANLGGTSLLPPLQFVYSQQVFLLEFFIEISSPREAIVQFLF